MEVHLWSSLLGLLYIPAVITWTVSQSPPAISLTTLNSSAEIQCSTSLPDPYGLSLLGRFHSNRHVVYLAFDMGEVKKKTIHAGFTGRVDVASDSSNHGFRISLRLSLLGLADTDLYECNWIYFNLKKMEKETLLSNGTILIVRERDPAEHCHGQFMDLIFIVLSLTAFVLIAIFITGVLTRKWTQVNRHYTPSRVTPKRHQHVCSQHGDHHFTNSNRSPDSLGFRGIL